MAKKTKGAEKKTKTYRPLKSIVCSDCGKKFESAAPKVKYCLKCRLKRFRPRNQVEIKVCLYCGEDFETTRPWAKFCSTPHRQAYHRQKYEEMLKSG